MTFSVRVHTRASTYTHVQILSQQCQFYSELLNEQISIISSNYREAPTPGICYRTVNLKWRKTLKSVKLLSKLMTEH